MEAGWTELSNGENFDGWHVYNSGENYDGWSIQSGVMVFDPALKEGTGPSDLISDKEYESFELSLEWMISEKGNSGLFWKVTEGPAYENVYDTGPEIQILDDNWMEYISERGDIQRAGSIFNVMAPKVIVAKPAGEWNEYILRINMNENRGSLKFNGTTVLDFPVKGKEWDKMVSKSGFAHRENFGTNPSGRIGLQAYGGKVAFRKIKIKEL